MFKASLLFLCFSSSFLAHAERAWPEFPIMVSCKEQSDAEFTIKLGLRPSTNEAWLYYKTPQMENPVFITAGETFGFYSSSSVKIESSRGEINSRNQVLRFSGHSSIVTRIVTYENFLLELERASDGNFRGKQLTYAFGKDAFPDSQVQGVIHLNNLSCSVTGV